MKDVLIRVEGLFHTYEQHQGVAAVTAVAGVDMTICDGEFVAVVGGNGSGKSTLAKHFNGLLLPTAGIVLVAGADTRDEAARGKIRDTVAMVFQNPDDQIVGQLVEEDVAFGAENRGLPAAEIRKRVDASLAAVGLSGYAKVAAHRLSGGEKQRLAIAGALATAPRCIVFDEVTSMLDPAARRRVLAAIHDLNRERGVAVVMITQEMEEICAADTVYVLNEGRVAFAGAPTALLREHDLLAACGLEVPVVVALADALRAGGMVIPETIFAEKELVEAVCHWF